MAKKIGLFCPICNREAKVYMNIYEHPNSMYGITCCSHINIHRCSEEEDAIDELKFLIMEIENIIENKAKELINKGFKG
jgi:hypothetical protein